MNFPDMEGANEKELLEFLDIVRTSGNMSDSSTLVHCRYEISLKNVSFREKFITNFSAGVGRSGTFIALDILIQNLKHKNYVNIFECVRKLRQQRAHMVQVEVRKCTVYHFRFCPLELLLFSATIYFIV